MAEKDIPIRAHNEFDNDLPRQFGFDKHEPIAFLTGHKGDAPLAVFVEQAANQITDYIFDEISAQIDWEKVESAIYETIMTQIYSYVVRTGKGESDE